MGILVDEDEDGAEAAGAYTGCEYSGISPMGELAL